MEELSLVIRWRVAVFKRFLYGMLLMNWFFNVFSEPAQQAQLIAIVFSMVVAISVVFINQWLLTRRARREIKIKKVEELYIAISEYADATYDFVSFSCDESNEFEMDLVREKFNRITDTLQKIDMYMTLYFPEVSFDINKYDYPHHEVYLVYCDELDSELSMGAEKIKAFGAIQENIRELKIAAKDLMERNKH